MGKLWTIIVWSRDRHHHGFDALILVDICRSRFRFSFLVHCHFVCRYDVTTALFCRGAK